MATATLHVPDVGGFVGPARCWRLDPPREIDGRRHEYITVVIQPRLGHQSCEVKTYPAGETGACADRQMNRRVGSFVLDTTPTTPEAIDGAHWLALQLLGGYEVTAGPDLSKESS